MGYSQTEVGCPHCGSKATHIITGDRFDVDWCLYCHDCYEADEARMDAAERGELADEMDWIGQ